jgi:GNAT superfamily N-acetyltransferase
MATEKFGNLVTVRIPVPEDTEAIAQLSGQYGYAANIDQMARRLQAVATDPLHAVFVAQAPDGSVVGWVHISARKTLIAGLQAEIDGLVVAEPCRYQGIGKALLARAERWAQENGCPMVTIRSGEARAGAHAFCNQMGYDQLRTQRVFRKFVAVGKPK